MLKKNRGKVLGKSWYNTLKLKGGAMDNTQLQYIKIQSQYIDKLEQFEKCIIKAAKAAHSLADTAEKKCGQA